MQGLKKRVSDEKHKNFANDVDGGLSLDEDQLKSLCSHNKEKYYDKQVSTSNFVLQTMKDALDELKTEKKITH